MKHLYLTVVALLLSFASFATGPITGDSTVCIGSTTTLSDATIGGNWWSSNGAIAQINNSSVGIVTGISAGTATITYSYSGVYSTITVIVNPTPSAIVSPAGDSICAGSTITLGDATSGGSWFTSTPTIATIGFVSGILFNATAGIDTVVYTLPTGCSTNLRLIFGSQTTGFIHGFSSVCTGSSITLSDAVTIGTWSASNGNATITGSGVVSGVSIGTDTILYSVPCASGSTPAMHIINVTNPTLGSIAGPSSVCQGATIYLSDGLSGGEWTNSSGGIVNINNSTSGAVYGASVGTATVTYTLLGCTGSPHATTSITVNANPPAIYVPSYVCPSSSITLSDATSPGTWSTANTTIATITPSTGIVTGIATGTATITYALASTGCQATTPVHVAAPTAGTISGPTGVCGGYTITLSENIAGGVWSCTNANATVTTGGVVTGVTVGIDTVNYTMATTCGTATATHIVTVSATAGTITGPSNVCVGSSIMMSDTTPGGTWASSSGSIAGIGSVAGTIYGYTAGTATITYSITGCGGTLYTTASVTVDSLPVVTANSSLSSCGGIYTLVASGATSYSWSPATGLSCSTCGTTTCIPLASTNYIVTGATTSGCSRTANVTVNGNRISGYITYTGAPTDSFRVWLINYDPVDSQIVATDSITSCMASGAPSYQFINKPTGSYMVKAKLFGTIPGTSGYVPTYSLSSPNWSTAATITHSSATDTMHINMVYGTVPSGSGFISGNVYSGAGRGTGTDVPAVSMLIFLEDGSGNVLTYTYTDTGGAYSFNSLAYDNYIIYPEDYKYYTTPSAVIILNGTTPSVTGVDFKQHTTSGIITPYDSAAGIKPLNSNAALNIFPNPAKDNLIIQWQNQPTGTANLVISDIVGRDVLKAMVNINTANGQSQLNISSLTEGVYFITIKSGNTLLNTKLLIQN